MMARNGEGMRGDQQVPAMSVSVPFVDSLVVRPLAWLLSNRWLWRAVVALLLALVSIVVACLVYALFYLWWIPRATFESAVDLQYVHACVMSAAMDSTSAASAGSTARTCGLPYAEALVDFSAGRFDGFLRPNQPYDLSVKLAAVDARHNHDLGTFMVSVELLHVPEMNQHTVSSLPLSNGSSNSTGNSRSNPNIDIDLFQHARLHATTIHRSSRAALLHYYSTVPRIVRVLGRLLAILLEFTREQQVLELVMLRDFMDGGAVRTGAVGASTGVSTAPTPITHARVHITSGIDNPHQMPRIYSMHLRITAHYTGLQYWMYYWFVPTAVVAVACMSVTAFVGMLFAWWVLEMVVRRGQSDGGDSDNMDEARHAVMATLGPRKRREARHATLPPELQPTPSTSTATSPMHTTTTTTPDTSRAASSASSSVPGRSGYHEDASSSSYLASGDDDDDGDEAAADSEDAVSPRLPFLQSDDDDETESDADNDDSDATTDTVIKNGGTAEPSSATSTSPRNIVPMLLLPLDNDTADDAQLSSTRGRSTATSMQGQLTQRRPPLTTTSSTTSSDESSASGVSSASMVMIGRSGHGERMSSSSNSRSPQRRADDSATDPKTTTKTTTRADANAE